MDVPHFRPWHGDRGFASARDCQGLFNRRVAVIHLCEVECPDAGEYALYVRRLRTFSPEGFRRSYMSTAMKQLKKWLDKLGTEVGELPPPLEPPGHGKPGPSDVDGDPLDPAEEALALGRLGAGGDGPAGRGEKIKAREREELREAKKRRMAGGLAQI